MRLAVLLTALALLATGVSGATRKKGAKAGSKSHSTTAASAKTGVRPGGKPHGTSTSARSSAKSGKRRGSAAVTHTTRRNVQANPSPERYQQIQEALASRGYFSGTPNGAWGAESVNALKRFQQDQNLPPDGKLSSLSLIAMGLGPKRTGAPLKPPGLPIAPPPPASTNPSSTPPQPAGAPAAVPPNPAPPPQEPAGAH